MTSHLWLVHSLSEFGEGFRGWNNPRSGGERGDNRHTLVDGIATRHFLQSAEKAGLGRDAALAVIDDLVERGPAAVDRIRQDLPVGFPNAIADSITRGVSSRLEQLASGRP